jgi:hypothetical protein
MTERVKLTLDGPRILFWDHNTGEQLWIDDDTRMLSLRWVAAGRATLKAQEPK